MSFLCVFFFCFVLNEFGGNMLQLGRADMEGLEGEQHLGACWEIPK